MKYASYIKYLLTVMVMVLLQACHETDEPSGPNETEPEPERLTSRTVLVYMVANNNLGTSGFDSADIKEMVSGAKEGQLGDGRLLVYHAEPKSIMLKEITSEGIDTLLVYDSNQLSVSIDRMQQVIEDTKRLAPADDYGLVLWSHAAGWLQDGIADDPSSRLRSFGVDGTSNGKKMNITSLAYALEGAGLSFIYFDCCYMGSVEVMYEMRKCAPYMVASAAEDPADGMPYHLNLKNLFNVDSPLSEAMTLSAQTTFNYYNDVFTVGDCPCTLAVVRSDRLDNLAELTRRIYSEAETSMVLGYDYQRFKVSGVCYYFDLDQYVESICPDEKLLSEWRKALADAVIYADATPYIWSSTPIKHHCGLSTFILSSQASATNNNYNTLSWYEDVASHLF